ncbi:hypothetical protein Tco_0731031 [Tanacetum coccineum]
MSADDNIISDDPDTALELGKSNSKTEAKEAEAARQPSTVGSNEGTSTIPRVPNESTVISATSSEGTGTKLGVLDEEKEITKENVILDWGSEQESEYLKEDKLDDEEKDDKEGNADDEDDETESHEDDIYKYKIHMRKDEDEKMINAKVDDSDKGDEEVTDAAKTNAERTLEVKDDLKKTELPPTSSSLSVSLVFVSSEPTVLIPVQESPLIATLRVAKLEKDVSELKKIDLFTKALAALKTQVPSVVDNYLRSKVRDVFQKELKKHTSDLIQKYSLRQLSKTLIEDENEMDNGVADTVQDHKRKHDDDKDDDDEDPPTRPNKVKQTKMRRTKDSESSKKPSTTKEIPKGKPSSKGSKTSKYALAKELVEEPIAKLVMNDASDDVVHDDDQPQDAFEPKTTKTPNPDWFKQPPNPPTPDLEWNKRQVVLDQPEQPWFNQNISATKNPLSFDDLMATPIDFSKYVLNRLKIDNLTQDILLGPAYNLLKGMCSSSKELEYHFQECFNALTNRLD